MTREKAVFFVVSPVSREQKHIWGLFSLNLFNVCLIWMHHPGFSWETFFGFVCLGVLSDTNCLFPFLSTCRRFLFVRWFGFLQLFVEKSFVFVYDKLFSI